MSMTKLQEEISKIAEKGLSKISDGDLASTYVHIYTIADDLKKTMENLKKEILKREISNKMFPEYQKKILLTEGNSSSVVDIQAVYRKALVKKEKDLFWDSVSISKTAIKDTILESIVEEFSKVITSKDKIVKVLKMTKEELKEAEIKK